MHILAGPQVAGTNPRCAELGYLALYTHFGSARNYIPL